MNEIVNADAKVVSLASIAKDINSEHDACRLSAADTVSHAIKIGKMLIEVNASLEFGEFMPWVARNCKFKRSSAGNYMRIARNFALCKLPSDW